MKIHALLAAASLVALAGCAAGPDYVAPIPAPAATAPLIGAAGPQVSTAAVEGDWWRLFRDPVLDGLVRDALAANTDVRAAVARLDRARASLREASNDRLPQTGLAASAEYGRVPAAETLPGLNRERWNVATGLSVAYEVDLFGRVSRSIEAARGDVGAAAADADAVRIGIVAETARAYADAASAAERQAVAERVVQLLDRSVDLTAKRFEAGRVTRLDLARLQALRDQRRALVPPLIAERQRALFRLATLTGRAPRDLPADASARKDTPRLDQPIPVGDGAALLARRPDVRAAERRLAGSVARIGVATSELYPQISLGGSVGSRGIGFGNLFGGGPFTWLLGPLINWTFPNQEGPRARIQEAEAGSREALARFDGTVLRALEETETALSNYAQDLQQQLSLTSARDAAERAVRITRARQREGQIDFLELLDAERTFADTQADLAQSNARIVQDQIDLFRALGGGWSAPQVADAGGVAVASAALQPSRSRNATTSLSVAR
jgi:NodT family efflux transporter outer membrane factor (OMF) lipoprotein